MPVTDQQCSSYTQLEASSGDVVHAGSHARMYSHVCHGGCLVTHTQQRLCHARCFTCTHGSPVCRLCVCCFLQVLEFTHFACTSEDINNLSHALSLQEAMKTQVRGARTTQCRHAHTNLHARAVIRQTASDSMAA